MLFLFSFCNRKKSISYKEEKENHDEELIKVNKYLVTKDAEIIEKYVERRNWDMKTTKTGLWYMIYDKGTGEKAETGKIATIYRQVSLLDGTVCYPKDTINPKQFRIGQGGVEQGLEQGILLLREGDKARFILPPHLAHGLIGDQKCIPGRASILYEVELVDISKNGD